MGKALIELLVRFLLASIVAFRQQADHASLTIVRSLGSVTVLSSLSAMVSFNTVFDGCS